MKTIYKGHEIDVTREQSLGGWDMLYYSIFRIDDGYECVSGFEDSNDTVKYLTKVLKERIDWELEQDDPWMENDD